jgi:hypothetical protein
MKSASDDELVDLLSSLMTVSGGEGGNCIDLDAACGCGWCSSDDGRGTPADACTATLMVGKDAMLNFRKA